MLSSGPRRHSGTLFPDGGKGLNMLNQVVGECIALSEKPPQVLRRGRILSAWPQF